MSEFGPTLKEQVSDHNAVLVCELKARILERRTLLDECEDVLDEAMIELDALRSGRTADRIAATLAKLRGEPDLTPLERRIIREMEEDKRALAEAKRALAALPEPPQENADETS